jgi:hypothetical protein
MAATGHDLPTSSSQVLVRSSCFQAWSTTTSDLPDTDLDQAIVGNMPELKYHLSIRFQMIHDLQNGQMSI